MAELLPLVDQARVDLADQLAEPFDEVGQLLALGLVGDGLPQGLVGVGEVPQHDALGPGQAVELHVLPEGHRPLVHVPHDGLGRDVVVADPGVAAPVDVVAGLEDVLKRLGPGDGVQQLHPLLVLDALGLHRGDGLAAGPELLGRQDLPGVVEGGLDHREHVEGVALRFAVEQLDRGQRERGERLVEREVVLQVDREPDVAALLVRLVQPLDHAAGQQRAVDLDRAVDVLALLGPVLVVVAQQVLQRQVGVPRAVDDVEHHRVGDGEARGERLRLGVDEALEGRLAPGDRALGRLLLDDPPTGHRFVAAGLGEGLGEGPLVVDDVLGCLDDDAARGVEAGPSRPSRDLVELADLQQPGLLAVVLGQRGEHDRADRHVDADAEGVGAADDLEQAGLGELLDQPPVFGEHARVVHADAVPDQSRERLSESRRESEFAD